MNTELQRLLQISVSNDVASLKEATAKLTELEKQAGYAPGLFTFLDDSNAENLQLLAAINLKNYIKKYWHGDELFDVPLADRAYVKEHLVNRMLRSRSRKLQEQLCECIILVASKDFPDEWPNMLSQMLGGLDLKELNSVLGVFQSLDGVFYKYRHEFRCESLWAEIDLVLTNFSALYFEVTKTICNQLSLLAGLAADQQRVLIEILYYCTRIFVSLISQELATHFEENLSTYMDCFMLVLNFQGSFDQVTSEFLIEAKVNVCEALSLLMHVYSSDFMPFAFEFMKTVWTLLISLDCNKVELDTLKCAAMQFLAKAVAADELAKVMSESSALQAVCEQVIIPNITIREQDFESYEDNPDEYIRKDIENTDTETPRRAAYDFIRALCLKLESQVIAVFGQYIESLLQAYAQNASDNWRQKDVATFLAICLAKKSHTAKHGATATSQFIDLNRFYVEALQPHLAEENLNNLPILKTDAMKFLTEFRYCLPKDLLIANLPHLIRIVGCDIYTVSVYASYAVERLLSMQIDNTPYFTSNDLRPFYSTMLENVLKALINRSNKCENDYAMKATLRMACRTDLLDDHAAKMIFEAVIGVLKAAAANPKKPLFNHYGFETIGYLSTWYSSKDDAATIRGVYSGVNVFLEEIYNKDISDFVPYALQIWSIMIAKAEPEMIQSIARKAMDIDRLCSNGSYVPPLVKLICALIFLQNKLIFPSEMPKIMGLVRKTIASRVRDRDGFELINAMTLHCDKTYFQPFLRDIYVLLFERLTVAKTPRFVQDFIRFNSLVIIQYGAAFTIELFDSLQANLFHMVCKKLYLGELKKVRRNEKIVIIGTTKLIVEPKFINTYSDLWIHMVQCLIQFIKCEPSPQAASGTTMAIVSEGSDSLEQLMQESDLSHNELKSCPLLTCDPVPSAASGTEYFRVEMSSFLSGTHKDLSADLLIQAKQIIASA